MITYELLQSKGACEGQLRLFKKTFPNGVEVTVEECVKYAQVFDFNWASRNLLVDQGAYKEAKAPLWEVYKEGKAPSLKAYKEAKATLWKAYKEVEAPLWRAYVEAKSPLLKAYREAEAPLWKAYEEANALLLKAYKEAEAPLLGAYEEGLAKAFAEQYIKENKL